MIDTAKHAVVANWPIQWGEGPSGMAIDLKNHRLFLGCSNKLMVVMDYTNGKNICFIHIGEGVDACVFDPATELAFASCREGTVTIAQADEHNTYMRLAGLKTPRGSRTMTLDPVTHKIYVAAADYEKGSEGQRRPNAVPGSFRVLVFVPAPASATPKQ